MVAFREVRFHNEGKILFPRFHLKHRSIVVSKMVVCSLPQIGMRQRRDFDSIRTDHIFRRLPRPLRILKFHRSEPPCCSMFKRNLNAERYMQHLKRSEDHFS